VQVGGDLGLVPCASSQRVTDTSRFRQ
jgi:hypothetical protein